MKQSMTYEEAIGEFRIMFDGDAWGSAMNMWFTIADEIYFNRDISVPDAWQFRPSPLGPSNDPDDYSTRVVSSLPDDDLTRFGKLMHRYATLLDKAGKSY